jgi:3D-(3,5/4)-trihydroxycyclohexane-1,2-dione acylhydrolase (decyclizing)
VHTRLQHFTGSASLNNLHADRPRERDVRVDSAGHASSKGAIAENVKSIGDLEAAFQRAKAADRTYVIVIDVHPHQWTPGDAWWDVGVPEVSRRDAVNKARADHEQGSQRQRIGV